LNNSEHPSYGWNVRVIEDEETSRFKMRVKVVILQIRERIAMGAINKGDLKAEMEIISGQGSLCRAFYEFNVISSQKR